MSKKKKNGNQDKTLKILILITAILNLIKSAVDLIQKFLEWAKGRETSPARRYYKSRVCFCQYIFKIVKGEKKMLDIILDVVSIVLSIATIVIVLKMWRGNN